MNQAELEKRLKGPTSVDLIAMAIVNSGLDVITQDQTKMADAVLELQEEYGENQPDLLSAIRIRHEGSRNLSDQIRGAFLY